MNNEDLKMLLAKLHDNYKLSNCELGRLVPTLDKRSLKRWVVEGRRLYQDRGIDRLTSALLE